MQLWERDVKVPTWKPDWKYHVKILKTKSRFKSILYKNVTDKGKNMWGFSFVYKILRHKNAWNTTLRIKQGKRKDCSCWG